MAAPRSLKDQLRDHFFEVRRAAVKAKEADKSALSTAAHDIESTALNNLFRVMKTAPGILAMPAGPARNELAQEVAESLFKEISIPINSSAISTSATKAEITAALDDPRSAYFNLAGIAANIIDSHSGLARRISGNILSMNALKDLIADAVMATLAKAKDVLIQQKAFTEAFDADNSPAVQKLEALETKLDTDPLPAAMTTALDAAAAPAGGPAGAAGGGVRIPKDTLKAFLIADVANRKQKIKDAYADAADLKAIGDSKRTTTRPLDAKKIDAAAQALEHKNLTDETEKTIKFLADTDAAAKALLAASRAPAHPDIPALRATSAAADAAVRLAQTEHTDAAEEARVAAEEAKVAADALLAAERDAADAVDALRMADELVTITQEELATAQTELDRTANNLAEAETRRDTEVAAAEAKAMDEIDPDADADVIARAFKEAGDRARALHADDIDRLNLEFTAAADAHEHARINNEDAITDADAARVESARLTTEAENARTLADDQAALAEVTAAALDTARTALNDRTREAKEALDILTPAAAAAAANPLAGLALTDHIARAAAAAVTKSREIGLTSSQQGLAAAAAVQAVINATRAIGTTPTDAQIIAAGKIAAERAQKAITDLGAGAAAGGNTIRDAAFAAASVILARSPTDALLETAKTSAMSAAAAAPPGGYDQTAIDILRAVSSTTSTVLSRAAIPLVTPDHVLNPLKAAARAHVDAAIKPTLDTAATEETQHLSKQAVQAQSRSVLQTLKKKHDIQVAPANEETKTMTLAGDPVEIPLVPGEPVKVTYKSPYWGSRESTAETKEEKDGKVSLSYEPDGTVEQAKAYLLAMLDLKNTQFLAGKGPADVSKLKTITVTKLPNSKPGANLDLILEAAKQLNAAGKTVHIELSPEVRQRYAKEKHIGNPLYNLVKKGSEAYREARARTELKKAEKETNVDPEAAEEKKTGPRPT